MKKHITKDSGQKKTYSTGMERDLQKEERFDLILPKGIPYNEQLITRFASLMGRGAIKYSDRNWEKAETQEEHDRFKESAFRHFMQWSCGEDDEDHAAAVLFNIQGAEMVDYKLNNKK